MEAHICAGTGLTPSHICAGTRLCRLLSVFYDLSMLQRVVLQTVRPAATQCCNMQRSRPVLVAIGFECSEALPEAARAREYRKPGPHPTSSLPPHAQTHTHLRTHAPHTRVRWYAPKRARPHVVDAKGMVPSRRSRSTRRCAIGSATLRPAGSRRRCGTW